jgi:transcriptional regulator with XRE-family HTH domain
VAPRSIPFLLAVGARVRHVREGRGWSQEHLADAAGVDRSYMSGIERGVRNISLLKLHAIAKALGIPPRDLLPGD